MLRGSSVTPRRPVWFQHNMPRNNNNIVTVGMNLGRSAKNKLDYVLEYFPESVLKELRSGSLRYALCLAP